MDGILIINKEKGYTSHDVVAKLRGILKIRRIGHTGTLDPDATGLLAVCIGRATKLCEELTGHDKVYETTLLLGITTDTQDISGHVIKESPVEADFDVIRQTISSFDGDMLQIPPMYSAKKVAGKKLYQLAREGKEIERKPVPIHIYRIDICSMELPRIKLCIHCSAGTYIRTICHDIGKTLGCGGCMESLKRISVGDFTLSAALTLNEVEESIKTEGKLEKHLISIPAFYSSLPAVSVQENSEKKLHNANPLLAKELTDIEENLFYSKYTGCLADKEQIISWQNPQTIQDELKIRVFDKSGSFIGIYQYRQASSFFMIDKMFFGGK